MTTDQTIRRIKRKLIRNYEYVEVVWNTGYWFIICEFSKRNGPEISTEFYQREVDAYREAERIMKG